MKKTQAKFSGDDDLKLLREVVAVDPFSQKGRWDLIGKTLIAAVNRPNFDIDCRCVRERTQHLLADFKKEDGAAKKK